jgi:hypothetical protein
MTLTIEVSTIEYENNYGKKPKGYGVWWFSIEGHEFGMPSMNYGHALKAAKLKAKELAGDAEGYFILTVLC